MSTYSSRLRAKLDPKHPCNRSFNQPTLSRDLADRLAEAKYQADMYGGYNKRNKCTIHNILLTVTNVCSFCE